MMGQQQQTIMAAGTTLRRIMIVVAVAALMVAMMAVSAMPAMAKNFKFDDALKDLVYPMTAASTLHAVHESLGLAAANSLNSKEGSGLADRAQALLMPEFPRRAMPEAWFPRRPSFSIMKGGGLVVRSYGG